MIPPQFHKAKVTPQDGDLPANREAQRALVSVLMLARQLDSQLRAAEIPLTQLVEKLPLKPAWQTEVKRAGLDPDEVLDLANTFLVLHRGAGSVCSGGKPEPDAPVTPSIHDEPGR